MHALLDLSHAESLMCFQVTFSDFYNQYVGDSRTFSDLQETWDFWGKLYE